MYFGYMIIYGHILEWGMGGKKSIRNGHILCTSLVPQGERIALPIYIYIFPQILQQSMCNNKYMIASADTTLKSIDTTSKLI